MFDPASFRDNDAQVFYYKKQVYRAISCEYLKIFQQLEASGLFKHLIQKGWLIEHNKVDVLSFGDISIDKERFPLIIQPKQIPFISYPYEWTFSQLKDAALLTLNVQLEALKFGFTLKDASAFNVQFIGSKPVFIDTTSFEPYDGKSPWYAYGQFCRHFLAPLLLIRYGFTNANALFLEHIDGVPLALTSRLLPYKTRFNFFTLMHLHWHAKAEERTKSVKKTAKDKLVITKNKLTNLLLHLRDGIEKLNVEQKTNWTDYYQTNSYSNSDFEVKKQFVESIIGEQKPKWVFDLGCNTGEFSEIAAHNGCNVLALDNDRWVIEQLHKKNKYSNLLPLVCDLSNPTPAIGWKNEERKSLLERLKGYNDNSLILALALTHHLRISNNLSFAMQAQFFASLTEKLIIEWVPKEDSQTQKLLVVRKDVYSDFTLDNFIHNFTRFFSIIREEKIAGRILYFMKRK